MKLRDVALILAGGVLLFGCEKRMSYDQLDAMRADASNAVAQSQELQEKVEDLETKVDDLEGRLSAVEGTSSHIR